MKAIPALLILLAHGTALADPLLTSWFTTNSGQYARIYKTAVDETAGTKSSTWSRGAGIQNTPVYADVNEINYSANWVYIRTSGLASHMMGPWYKSAGNTADSNLFINYPSNTASIYRIPRNPTVPTTKTKTGGGTIGRFVNGVSFFDNRDAFTYVNSSGTEVNPGDGIWTRNAYPVEGATFDAPLAHQAGNNYHYHVQPIALRQQLGDHVDYNATTNRYTESTAPVTQHSPILAWAADGFPIYGPYGYSDPTNAASGVRRMVTGFTIRNGSNGTTNLASTGRTTLPAWAAAVQNRSAVLTNLQYGPTVSTNFALGRYLEDYDFLGDLGFTQTTGATVANFDLDKFNGRICVTPEFPTPHFCYFTTIDADGTPAFPYTMGRSFYGNPTGGTTNAATMNADTPLTQQFIGGANTPVAVKSATVNSGTVTITWSAVEGGTYSVDASPNQTTWTNKATGLVSTGISKSSSYATLAAYGTEYGRVNRTALATYDATGQTAATVAQSIVTSYLAGVQTAPTVTTPTAVSITGTTATLGGNVTSAGTDPVSARGVVFSPTATNSSPQIGGTGAVSVLGTGTTGVFTVNASSLSAGTAYTFAAYATSIAGTSYSAFGNFTTQTGIESWRQTWYGTSSNTGNAADNADPYKTGIQNLAVYAFFGPTQNPATARVGDLPQVQLGTNSLFFDFTEPSNLNGITYGAQSNSTLLAAWQSVIDTGTGTRHIFSVQASGNPQMFMRLKVTRP